MKAKIILLILSFSSGLTWSGIYMTFALMHDMPVMFNNEFIFLLAPIFDIEVKTILEGVIYSFVDGALAGGFLGILFIKLKRHFIDRN